MAVQVSKSVLSLFDYSGVMVEPWVEAGYEAWIVDIQHPQGVSRDSDGIVRVGADLRKPWSLPREFSFVAAFPPCTHVAVSGARWFKGKGLRALEEAVSCFATAAEVCEASGAPYLIENPVSTLSTYWRKPDYTFHPWEYAESTEDAYTKKTCLWVGGGFVMPTPRYALGDLEVDHTKIHYASPSPERGNLRSLTPRGFARAVFEANAD